MKLQRVLGVVLVLTVVAPAVWAGPTVTVESDRVVAEGLTPGTDAIWFAMIRKPDGWMWKIIRVDRVITDDDQDGRVVLQWDGKIPRHSVWTVVDSRNGQYDMAIPEGRPWRGFEVSMDGMLRQQGELVGVVQDNHKVLESLLVHPGMGAWGMATGDGTPNDADGLSNGSITIEFAGMYPLYDSGQSPGRMVPGGVLVLIDPLRLEHGATRVTGGPGAGEEVGAEAGVWQ